VLVQLDTLSCVFPDGATFERPLKGYATGEDGTLGLFGQLETRDSAYLARTFLTSLLSGAAEAFALAKRTVVVTPFGGTQSTIQGGAVGETAGFSALASATAQLSQFYLQQAAQLLPVLWAPSGTRARLILQEGLPLEGLPTSTTLVEGGVH
jgi:conjugal transfer pilus assembly protein TraB